jgi:hypothetical protein
MLFRRRPAFRISSFSATLLLLLHRERALVRQVQQPGLQGRGVDSGRHIALPTLRSGRHVPGEGEVAFAELKRKGLQA